VKSATAHRQTVTNKPKKETSVVILQLEKKDKMKQPPHKTAHLQAPTHEPLLLLAKELFSCQRIGGKLIYL